MEVIEIQLEVIDLKFLLKLLGFPNYRATLSQIKPNPKTKASERNKICRKLLNSQLVECRQEISKIKLTSPGQALLKLEGVKDKFTPQEFKILKACQQQTIPVSDTKVTPAHLRQELIEKLVFQGYLQAAQTDLKEVWLTTKGKDYLAKEYNPSGSYNPVISTQMLGDYLRFIRQHLSVSPQVEKPTDEKILQTIVELDREYNTDNYLPIFHLRNKFQPPLSRGELDEALFRLEKDDCIEISTLTEVDFYSPQEINAGIPQPVGGALFFIVVT